MARLFHLCHRRTIDARVDLGAFELPPHDLLTHGVIVGMTGSGKTGLVTVNVEEALRSGVPVLVVDVKRDHPNIRRTFVRFGGREQERSISRMKQSWRTYCSQRSTRALSVGWRARAGSTTKPRLRVLKEAVGGTRVGRTVLCDNRLGVSGSSARRTPPSGLRVQPQPARRARTPRQVAG